MYFQHHAASCGIVQQLYHLFCCSMCAVGLFCYNSVQVHYNSRVKCECEIHKRYHHLLECVGFFWVKRGWVVYLVRHLGGCESIIGRIIMMGGVLRSGWWGVI